MNFYFALYLVVKSSDFFTLRIYYFDFLKEINKLPKWRNKMRYIHTTGYYSVLKRKEILTHTTMQTNLEDIMRSEISLSQKDKCCMTPL